MKHLDLINQVDPVEIVPEKSRPSKKKFIRTCFSKFGMSIMVIKSKYMSVGVKRPYENVNI